MIWQNFLKNIQKKVRKYLSQFNLFFFKVRDIVRGSFKKAIGKGDDSYGKRLYYFYDWT